MFYSSIRVNEKGWKSARVKTAERNQRDSRDPPTVAIILLLFLPDTLVSATGRLPVLAGPAAFHDGRVLAAITAIVSLVGFIRCDRILKTGIRIPPAHHLTIGCTFQRLVGAIRIGIIHVAPNLIPDNGTNECTGSRTEIFILAVRDIISNHAAQYAADHGPDDLAVAAPGADPNCLTGCSELHRGILTVVVNGRIPIRLVDDNHRLGIIVMMVAAIAMCRRPRWRAPLVAVATFILILRLVVALVPTLMPVFVFVPFMFVTIAIAGIVLPWRIRGSWQRDKDACGNEEDREDAQCHFEETLVIIGQPCTLIGPQATSLRNTGRFVLHITKCMAGVSCAARSPPPSTKNDHPVILRASSG